MSDEKLKTERTYSEAEILQAAIKALNVAGSKPAAFGAAMRIGINEVLQNLKLNV